MENHASASVALLTGNMAEVGAATAFALAKDGFRLIISGDDEAVGRALAQRIRDLRSDAAFIKSDVRRESGVCSLIGSALRNFGRIDVAINNAAFFARGKQADSCSFAVMFGEDDCRSLAVVQRALRAQFASISGPGFFESGVPPKPSLCSFGRANTRDRGSMRWW